MRLPVLPKGQPLTLAETLWATRMIAEAYDRGADIRDIARAVGRSYEWTRSRLNAAGVALYPRGARRADETRIHINFS